MWQVEHTSNLSAQEAEAGGLEFEASLYRETYLKK
jgi:hypothetical protein